MSKKTISERHLATLAAAAIAPDVARQFGIWSAESASDLPDDLSFRKSAVPGLVFPLETVDGSVVHQIRVDHPEDNDGAKCLQPGGVGSVLTCYPQMRDRIGEAGVDRILVVEGTKQTIVATRYAPDDVVVCGIQGCRNWSSGGVAIPELAMLDPRGKEVILAFDADLRENHAVWSAADSLSKNFKQLGAESVRFLSTNSGGKTGLDDYLGFTFPVERYGMERSDALRTETLNRLIDLAASKLGRAPRRDTSSKTRSLQKLACDMDSGTTVQPGLPATSSTPATPAVPVADFAGRIVRSISITDPDNPDNVIPLQLELEIAIPAGDGGVETYPVKVSDQSLHKLGDILASLPGGIGASIPRPITPGDCNDVANAIRTCRKDKIQPVQAWKHLGWQMYEGDLYYLHAGGGIGVHGNNTDIQAWLSTGYRAIDFAAALEKGQDPETLTDAVRSSISILDLLIDPTPWFAMLATAGLAPLGPIGGAAVGLVANPSAGKSAILQTATAFLSPAWAYEVGLMNSADATAVATDLAMSGNDNSWVLVDDLHPEFSRSEQERQSKGIDAALRRAHGAPSKGKGKISRDTGEVETATQNHSYPILHLAIEPEVMANLANSGIDRMLTIVMEAKTSFLPGKYSEFVEPGRDGRLQVAYANYILATARDIHSGSTPGEDWLQDWMKEIGVSGWPKDDPAVALRLWNHCWNARRQVFAQTVADLCPLSSKRSVGVVAGLAIGLRRWLLYAASTGAITADEAQRLFVDGSNLFIESLTRHTEQTMGDNTPPVETTLRLYHSAIASGRYSLAVKGKPDQPSATVVGKKTKVDGIECVALINDIKVPGVVGKPASILSEIVLADEANGSLSRQVRIGDSRPMCAVIPYVLWENLGHKPAEGLNPGQQLQAIGSGAMATDDDEDADDFGYDEDES
jgi:hypothetical protein